MKKGILFFLIPAALFILGIIFINMDHSPEVVYVPQAYGPGTGYELQKEAYTVTASPHYRWKTETGDALKVLLGFICMAIGGGYVWYVEAKVKKQRTFILVLLWLAAAFLTFGEHAFKYYEPGHLTKTINGVEYEQNKNDLDKIFEQ